MINFADVTNGNNIKDNPNWHSIPDHPHVILIIGGSASGKTNVQLNSISHQLDNDKIDQHANGPFEAK